VESLTAREREVMELVIGGFLNKQIAKRLDITEATVKAHRGRVMEKIGVRSVAELVRLSERSRVT
jgi:FixJ family two-component response regulator